MAWPLAVRLVATFAQMMGEMTMFFGKQSEELPGGGRTVPGFIGYHPG